MNDVFDYLTITALVEEEVFVVHGGLSPNIQTVNQIREMDRIVDIGTISFFLFYSFIDSFIIKKVQ